MTFELKYAKIVIIKVRKEREMVLRKEYLSLLKEWKDEKVIKVITGIRRSGKSTLLKQFEDTLISLGISKEQIHFFNFEDIDYEELLDYKKLYNRINENLVKSKMNYVLLDEVQKVESFEKAVDSLYIKDNVDIYITGSNAYLLSSELSTLLSGRYVEINMLPLSFKEYFELKGGEKDAAFSDYLKYGGLPYAATLNGSENKIDTYLEGIYNTIIIKDIEERSRRKESDPNKRKINDILLLKNISKFLASSIGNLISLKSISDYLTSSGRKTSQNTVSDYLEALVEPYIFYPAQRYDVVGKQLLKTNQKFYVVDLGIRRYLLPRKSYDLGFSLENTVFFELIRRGYEVNVGKIGTGEVDFVAKKNGRYHYFQVTASMLEESTFNREMSALTSIKDNYPKNVITLDRYTPGNYDGIDVVNAVDWLLA